MAGTVRYAVLMATRTLCLLSLFSLSACSTAISTMQPADTLGKGDFHVGGGTNVAIPATSIIDAVDAADDLAEKYREDANYAPTQDEEREYIGALVGLALNAPGVSSDLMLRYGLFEHFDFGLRYTASGWHADGKYQFLDAVSGWDGSLSVGVSRYSFDGTIFDALEFLEIEEFSRNDIEVPLIFGKKLGNFGRIWGGPKYIYASYSIDAEVANGTGLSSTEGSIHYFGGFAGASVGYKWLQLFAEATVMNTIATPVILDEETDLGGIVIMPSLGLMARW